MHKMTEKINEFIGWKSTYTKTAPLTYRLHLERLARFVKNKPIEEISLEDIVSFEHHIRGLYSPANVAYSVLVIKNFFQFLLRRGVRTIDPWFIRIPRHDPNPHPTLERYEFEALSKIPDDTEFYGLEFKLILNLLWDTGMRIGELVSMNVDMIDPKIQMASIITEKNRQMRWIMWSKETHNLLLRYLGIRICLNQQPALFIANETGGRRNRICPRTLQRWITALVKKSGIKKRITAHSFRHGKAHEILRMGGGVKEIQSILGHSEDNPRSAFSYLHLDRREFVEIASKYL